MNVNYELILFLWIYAVVAVGTGVGLDDAAGFKPGDQRPVSRVVAVFFWPIWVPSVLVANAVKNGMRP